MGLSRKEISPTAEVKAQRANWWCVRKALWAEHHMCMAQKLERQGRRQKCCFHLTFPYLSILFCISPQIWIPMFLDTKKWNQHENLPRSARGSRLSWCSWWHLAASSAAPKCPAGDSCGSSLRWCPAFESQCLAEATGAGGGRRPVVESFSAPCFGLSGVPGLDFWGEDGRSAKLTHPFGVPVFFVNACAMAGQKNIRVHHVLSHFQITQTLLNDREEVSCPVIFSIKPSNLGLWAIQSDSNLCPSCVRLHSSWLEFELAHETFWDKFDAELLSLTATCIGFG